MHWNCNVSHAVFWQMDFVLVIVPAVRQPQLYDLCGSTLNLIFDLSVPYASAVIEPLLNVSAIGNLCPPIRALKSNISRGFDCNVGEVLNMDTNDVPRCCEYYTSFVDIWWSGRLFLTVYLLKYTAVVWGSHIVVVCCHGYSRGCKRPCCLLGMHRC